MYEYPARVTTSQTNAEGLQTALAALNLMQDCSQLWLESEPALRQWFAANNTAQMLVFRQADFLRPARYGERLTVATSVYECKSYYGFRNTFLYDETGAPVAKSWSIGAFVSLETGRPVRLPQEITDAVCYDAKLEMEYTDKKLRAPEGRFSPCPPVTARAADIDFNRHVNNAQYIRMALDCLPEDFPFNRLRVEYKLPAKRGDVLLPSVCLPGDGAAFVRLENGQGQPYASVEFSTAAL